MRKLGLWLWLEVLILGAVDMRLRVCQVDNKAGMPVPLPSKKDKKA